MDLFYFAIGYFALTAFFIFILLFGESPVFKGTPVAWVHWLVTTGILDGLEWLIKRVCGARGARALDTCYISCCERPNPAMQIAYLVLVLSGFYLYWTNLFALLPNHWVDRGHILSGSASVLTALALFAAACASDPGTVRPSDPAALAAWHTLYPLDDILFPAKECTTCGLMRPARSKHCRVCNRCVGRHDHHCHWINNCVGYNNMRIFLAFLVANLAMCSYGAVLAALILGGEMERRGIFQMQLINYRTGRVVPMWTVPGKVLEWLVAYYPVGMALALFLVVASLLVAAFLAFQLYLLAVGKTQYEMFKWRDLHRGLLDQVEEQEAAAEEEQAEAEAKQAAVAAAEAGNGAGQGQQAKQRAQQQRGAAWTGTSGKRAGRRSGWGWVGGWFGGRAGARVRVRVRAAPVLMPPNIYHRGFLKNLAEVLLPQYYLLRAQRMAARLPAEADYWGPGKREEAGGQAVAGGAQLGAGGASGRGGRGDGGAGPGATGRGQQGKGAGGRAGGKKVN